jgi:hypothetical protein
MLYFGGSLPYFQKNSFLDSQAAQAAAATAAEAMLPGIVILS